MEEKPQRNIKSPHHNLNSLGEPLVKKKPTKEDFIEFCSVVLAYTQYETLKQEDIRLANNCSPLGSVGSESYSSEGSVYDAHNSEVPNSISGLSTENLANGNTCKTSSESSNVTVYESSDFANVKNIKVESDESWNLITCFCMKPFAGRPMIECSICFKWIHLSCAKIRKNNIPKEFECQSCRETSQSTRKSNRRRSEKLYLPV